MVQQQMHGETMIKIEIPHKIVKKHVVQQVGLVTW